MNPDLLIALTDLIGSQAEREHTAETRGYQRGYREGHAAGEEAGYLRAVTEIKRINADLPRALRDDIAMWPPHGRAAFGRPRPGDYPGAGAA